MNDEARQDQALQVEDLAIELARQGVPAPIVELLETAAQWLQDGPCQHCGTYHHPGSC